MAVQSLKSNVLFTWLAHLAALVTGFFLMPYVMRVLGDASYGQWVFINSFVAYGGLLYMGMGETICRYVAKYHSEGNTRGMNEVVTIVASVYSLGAAFAFLLSLGIALLLPWISPWTGQELLEIQLVVVILGLNLAMSLLGSIFGGVLMGVRRFDLERTVGIVFDLVRVALIFVFLHREWGLLTMALIYMIITVLENGAFMILAWRALPELQINRTHWKYSVLKECTSFSSMALLNNFAQSLIYATDSIVIGFLMGAEAIVPYYIALRLVQFIRQPIEKVAFICMPTAGAMQSSADRGKLHKLFLQAIGVTFLLAAGINLGAYFFGGDLITLWVGAGYEESHRLLVILLAATVVTLPCNLLRSFLLAQGTIRFPAMIYFAEAIANLVISLGLGWMLGRVGVAIGTLIPAVILEAGILLPFGLSILGISSMRLLKEAIRPQLVPLAALAGYCLLISPQPWAHGSWLALMGVSAGGGVVLGGAWLLMQHSPGRWLPEVMRRQEA